MCDHMGAYRQPPVEPYTLNPYQSQANATEPAPKPDGREAARSLSALIRRELGDSIEPHELRLFILAYWSRVAKLAHEIHDDRD